MWKTCAGRTLAFPSFCRPVRSATTKARSPTKSAADYKKDFEGVVANQGFIGQTYDWMKDHLGASGSDHSSTLKQAWSYVLDYDKSSDAVRDRLAKTEDSYAALSGLTAYDHSQKDGVDTITYAAAFAAGPTKARTVSTFYRSMLMGGVARASLKAIDGTYSSPIADFATGGMMGSLAQFPKIQIRQEIKRESAQLVENSAIPLRKRMSEMQPSASENLSRDP